MEKPQKTQFQQKSSPRPLTSEEILRQANLILNLKSKDKTLSPADYQTFLQIQKEKTKITSYLSKKPSNIRAILAPVLKHTPSHSKPQLTTQSIDVQLFEDSKQNCIDEYSIGKLIGTGAYASVKTAVLKSEGKKFALKTYEKYRLSDPTKKKNVGREIEILKTLEHPNIVKMYKVIETPKQLHLVLDFIPGGSLGAFLKKKPGRRMEEIECKLIFRQLVGAVEYIHSQKVTHRDLKLENLLMEDETVVKVIDFGFSTCFSHDKKVKLFCGTPTYMAPEIVSRKEYSGPPADVWALGILLFVMLCGCFPFKAPTDRELFKKIEKGVFSIPSHVSAGARGLIHKILSVDPESRPKASEIFIDSWINDSPKPKDASKILIKAN